MKAHFELFVRTHRSGWQTASVLGHPRIATSGRDLPRLREQLREVLARELALSRLQAPPEGATPEVLTLDLILNAVEGERLVPVPVRFTLALTEARADVWQVRVPVLELAFLIRGRQHVEAWAAEQIRGHLHLEPVTELVALADARREWIESLEVTWHGPGRYKRELAVIKAQRRMKEEHGTPSSPLASVGVELVEEASKGRLSHALGRPTELQQLISTLARPSVASVVLVGVSGVGKTALVHELAHRIANDAVPTRLRGRQVWLVEGARLIAGASFLGQWQERALGVAREAERIGAILFVGGLLELVRAGGHQPGLDMGQLLLPFVERGSLRVVAEATPESYATASRTHPGLVRVLQRQTVLGMHPDDAYRVLETLAGRLGRSQRTTVTEPCLQASLGLLARFGRHDALPGSGVNLLEQMIRRYPGETLGRQQAIDAFCASTGFPRAIVDDDVAIDEESLREFFTERIVGQPDGVEHLVELLMVVGAGLSDPDKPLGSFLLMGPTGVGKTESAKALAAWLFGSAERMVRLDMSEFGALGSARRLVDGPGGQGLLTTKVREQPFGVLLLDEVEKAEPGVFDVLLQVLGEGRLTDGTGMTVSFRHTIVLMTSNLGAAAPRRLGLVPDTPSDAARAYRRAAEDFFRPELVNRIDAIVPYRALDPGDLRTIARALLRSALAREGLRRRGVTIDWDETLLDHLVEVGFDPRFGARPMKRAIDTEVMGPVATALVQQTATAPDLRLVIVDGRVEVRPTSG